MAFKKHDFIEIEYTGKLEDGSVFDTTDEALAKEHHIFSEKMAYGPVVICIGEGHVLQGLDAFLEGKDVGEFNVPLEPEQAFGKKNAKLIQLVPTNKFKQAGITPQIGLQVNIDGHLGIIKTVTGGRTLVDFNHPLSSQKVVYDVKVLKPVTDKKEQVKALITMQLNVSPEIVVEEKNVKISIKQEIPQEIKDALSKQIKEICGFEKVEF